MKGQGFVRQCVFVDLEVDSRGRLRHLGAICGQSQLEQAGRRLGAAQALGDLDRFVSQSGASMQAGHNLLQHDCPILQQMAPDLGMLQPPVVDTLFLSPLAFPQNPYHGLVKDYKLVRTERNNPAADARLSAKLLGDKRRALAGLPAKTRDQSLSLIRFCFEHDEAGFRYVLVDEYQDIDEEQYELIAAITGRTIGDDDQKLSILAVGDDDQNVYSFRGANVKYIRRFQQDYRGCVHYLLENHRSTAHIIAAANQLIAINADRMKTEHQICIDSASKNEPAGGEWRSLDPVGRGRVQVVQVPGEGKPAAIVAELQRLKQIQPDLGWAHCAVLSRTRESLLAIRAACEYLGIPIAWGLDTKRAPRLYRLREIATLLDQLRNLANEDRNAAQLIDLAGISDMTKNPWQAMLWEVLREWQNQTENAKLTVAAFTEHLYKSLAERRMEQRLGGGVFVSTVHAAKGMEFDHVIIPARGWTYKQNRDSREEERRLYYVAMTRARKTLTLCTMSGLANPHASRLEGDSILRRKAVAATTVPPEVQTRRIETLRRDEIDLGYGGSQPESQRIHTALAELHPGSELAVRSLGADRLGLVTESGHCVARLSKTGSQRWRKRINAVEKAHVLGLFRRYRSDEQAVFRSRCQKDQWEVPLVEFVYQER